MVKMKKKLVNIIGIIVSGYLLWHTFRNEDLDELKAAIFSADKFYLFLGIVVTIPIFMLRSFRWKYLFDKKLSITRWNLFSAMMVGYLGNNVLPARAGEFLRAYLLGKSENISKSLVFATILVERLTDLIVTLLLLGLIVWLFPFPDWLLSGGISIGIIGVSVIVFLILLTVFGEKIILWCKDKFSFLSKNFISRLELVASGFLTGVASLKRDVLMKYIFLTSAIWLSETTLVWLLAQSFGLPLSFLSSLFLMLVIGIGSVVPSSPGHIGTFEFFATSALSFMLISGTAALGFVLTLHVVTFFGSSIIGLFCLMINNVKASALLKRATDVA